MLLCQSWCVFHPCVCGFRVECACRNNDKNMNFWKKARAERAQGLYTITIYFLRPVKVKGSLENGVEQTIMAIIFVFGDVLRC